MNAQQLQYESGQRVLLFVCMKCRKAYGEKSDAEGCCIPHLCKMCGEEVPIDLHRQTHPECMSKQIERSRHAKAKWTEAYDGPLYMEGLGDEEYFETESDLIEYLESGDIPHDEWPTYAWCCTEHPVYLNTDTIVDKMQENHPEGVIENITGWNELADAVRVFNDTNAKLYSWEVDYSRYVTLPKPEEVFEEVELEETTSIVEVKNDE